MGLLELDAIKIQNYRTSLCVWVKSPIEVTDVDLLFRKPFGDYCIIDGVKHHIKAVQRMNADMIIKAGDLVGVWCLPVKEKGLRG